MAQLAFYLYEKTVHLLTIKFNQYLLQLIQLP